MKNIFTHKKILICFLVFALALFFSLVFSLSQWIFHMDLAFILFLALIGLFVSAGYFVQLRKEHWSSFREWLIRIGVLRPPSEETPLSHEQQQAQQILLFHTLRSPRFPT